MEEALVGFLGAALGAVLGSWATIRNQRRQEQREDRLRYSAENRQLLLDFLEAARDRAWEVRRQLEAAWQMALGRIPESEIPTLGTTDALRRQVERVEDAIPERKLSHHTARFLFLAVDFLSVHAYRAGVPPIDPDSDERWREDWRHYEEALELARRTAHADIGGSTTTRALRGGRRKLLSS